MHDMQMTSTISSGLKIFLAIGVILIASGSSSQQVSSQSVASLSSTQTVVFDVASIREVKPDGPASTVFIDPPHNSVFHLSATPAWYLITTAYGIQLFQLLGKPDWLMQTRYDVNAKSDSVADERLAQLDDAQAALEKHRMVQQLLADRFHLKVHWGTQEGDVYNLVIAKGGSKLLDANGSAVSEQESKLFKGNTIPPIYRRTVSGTETDFVAHGCQMSDIVELLSQQSGRAVIDKTGLTGRYNFVLKTSGDFARGDRSAYSSPLLPLSEAIQEQIGIKLEPSKGAAKTLSIDHIEKPSEN